MAAVVTLMARDKNYPKITHQVLVVPMLSPATITQSYLQYWDDHLLNAKVMSWFWLSYCAKVPAHLCAKDRYCSPLAATSSDLVKLPKTTVFVCDHDVLKSDGVFYYDMLANAGVDAELKILSGSHMFPLLESTVEKIVDAIIF